MRNPLVVSLHAVCAALIFVCAFSVSTNAQDYAFAATSGTFTPLTGATAVDPLGLENEELSAAIPIGFDFYYFGSALADKYTQVKVSSNGFLNFNLSSFSANQDNSFMATTSEPMIAVLWDDLDPSSGTVSYKTEGSAPNRIFTVEWLNVEWSYLASMPSISFQVKLYETSNKIEMIYKPVSAPFDADASIGLIRNNKQFYSLSNSSASPSLSPTANVNISTSPADGQIYTFTPTVAPTTPVTQASGITAVANPGTSLDLSWANGSGAYRAVFMKQTALTSDNVNSEIVNGINYIAKSEYGQGDQPGDGWFCVYNGTGSSVTVTQLDQGLPYQIQVIEYNGLAGSQKYLTTTSGTNPVNITTLLPVPTTNSTVAPLNVTSTKLLFSIPDLGNGASRAVFMKAATSGAAPAVNNTTYTASTVFGSGTQIGTSGWYCVMNAASPPPSITVTGLTPNTDYVIHVVDYNGPAGLQKYNTTSSANDNKTFKTFATPSVTPYNFSASTTTFVPLSGGVSLPIADNSDDNVKSTLLPIGFPFVFQGTTFTQFWVHTNGILSLNPFVESFNPLIEDNNLNTTLLRPIIAPLWDDLDGEQGQASYLTTGTPGSRVLTVEYLNWRWNAIATSAVISFQIKFYEINNGIEFVYRPESLPVNNGSASIGVAFSEVGTFMSLNNTSASPTVSSVTETNTIATKPADGQAYGFTQSLVKAPQTITFGSLAAKTFGDANFTLTGTASSGLPVTYTSSNTAVATISGNEVTIVGAGSTTITASQPGNFAYQAATSVPQTLTVSKASQTISFTLSPSTKTVGDANFNLTATATSGLAVSFASSNTAVATISGNTVTIVGAGTTTITALQAGNTNYNAASDVTQVLTVNPLKSDQTITFNALPSKVMFDLPFALTATASSGLAVTYTSSNTGVATISGTTVTIVGVGSTDITASQPGNGSFNPAPDVVQTLTVLKKDQTITFSPLADKKVGDPDFNLAATTPSGLPIIYQSSDPSVATISGNTVTIVGFGVTLITAQQDGDAYYNPAMDVTQPLNVKSDQTITFGPLAAKTVGDVPFALGATASSGLIVTYTSSNNAVATVSGDVVTIVGAGTTTITASQSGNATFIAAEDVAQTLVVNKVPQTIAFASLTAKTYLDIPFTLGGSASSGLTLTYVSSNTDVATISGNTVTIIGAGTTNITASQSGDEIYSAATDVVQSLTVNKAPQTITFAALSARKITDGNFTLSATSGSSLPVSYSSSNPGIATISGNTVNVVGVGIVNITASQSGNGNYNAAPNVVRSLTVNKGDQTITFGPIPEKTTSEGTFTLNATSSSGLPVSYTSSNTAVATVFGNTVTLVGPGITNITASQAGNGTYNIATSVVQPLRVKGSQTITFAALPVKTFGDAPITLSATASSGLPVTFTSSNDAVATISGNVLTIVSGGTATITASQEGNSNYGPATPVERVFTVNKARQSITFAALPTKTMGDAPITFTATSSSGLPVTFSIGTDDELSLNGSEYVIVKPGFVTVSASQAGNAFYANAPTVQRTFCINPAKPTITVTDSDSESPTLTSSSEIGENQWYRDGVLLPGESKRSLTVNGAGVYTVKATVQGCASTISEGRAVVITGAEVPEESLVKIYPNPVEDEFLIDVSSLKARGEVGVTLIDLSGKQLQSWIGRNKFKCNISAYKAGNYLIQVYTGKQVITKQITKK